MKLWGTETGQCIKRSSNGKTPYVIRFHPEAKDSRVADQKSDPTGVGGRTVKRSGSSGVPRFPKNGQHFKPWKDEGTFSSLVSRSLNSY